MKKQSVNFLPELTEEELEEKQKVSKAGLYSAILPVLASLIWVIAVLINSYYKGEVKAVESEVASREAKIETYLEVRKVQTELVKKVEALNEIVDKDFYPQKFFNDVEKTIKSTGDAEAEIYSYSRSDNGVFTIRGKANSYLDLAKIMVVFNGKEEFEGVDIRSISYDRKGKYVNFEIEFLYAETDEE